MRVWLWQIVKFHKWRLAVLILFTLLGSLVTLASPWPMQILADYVFGDLTAPWIFAEYSQTMKLLYIAAGFSLLILLSANLSAFYRCGSDRSIYIKLKKAFRNTFLKRYFLQETGRSPD